MSHFTPGPWTIKGETLDREIEIVSGALTVCIVLPDDDEADNTYADARLIAAAPDLFEYVRSSAQAGCATARALVEPLRPRETPIENAS